MKSFKVPLIIRGKVFDDTDIAFGGRRNGVQLETVDIRRYLASLPLDRGSDLADLYSLSLDDIVDYLVELNSHLDLRRNVYMQEALEVATLTSGLTPGILANTYAGVSRFFSREFLYDWVDRTIGRDYLEGWVERPYLAGGKAAVRAVGARAIHVVAGNSPMVSMQTVAQNAITRSDAIIKAPSNDPLTAAAIARTMIDMAPDHPLTRHLSVAYWKGGDTQVEEALYQPRNIEKLVAWGGFASITHIARYVQPGIDLITLDPKLSSTIVGRETFADDAATAEAAKRLANDIGCNNQEGCVNARVVYIETGLDKAGLETANRFGKMVYEQLQALPPHVSGAALALPSELADELASLKFTLNRFRLFGGGGAGAVVVSQVDEPVEFARMLSSRVANLVPVDDLEVPVRAVTAYTQTIGVYPEAVKLRLRDRLAVQGAQRVVSLGYASNSPPAGPHDGIEPLRRLCRWVVDESHDPQAFPPPSERRPAMALLEAGDPAPR